MTQYSFGLKAAQHTNVLNLIGSEWTFHNGPAYFDFELDSTKFLKGLVNIEFHARGLEDNLPIILFDFGQGFVSHEKQKMKRLDPTRYKTRMILKKIHALYDYFSPKKMEHFKHHSFLYIE